MAVASDAAVRIVPVCVSRSMTGVSYMYAGVPCYNLRKLAGEIAPDMPRLRTLRQAWAEMIESAERQRHDPSYQYRTPLPATAHPAVLREDEVVLPDGERLAAEASIGDLAHR